MDAIYRPRSDGTVMVRAEVVETTEEETRAAGPSNDSSDDDGVHIRGRTAHSRVNLEKDKGRDVEPFHVKACGQHPDREHNCDGSEREAGANPCQLVDVNESLYDGALNVSGNGCIKTVDESADVGETNRRETI